MDRSELIKGDAPKPLFFRHFPTRTAAVVWRNWGMITPECLAGVLHTTPDAVIELAEAMGLSVGEEVPMALWRRRGYITLIRRNWELLPYSQLLKLLDFTPEKLDFLLREDDFLWTKLGKSKPDAEELFFEPVTAETALVRRLLAVSRRDSRIGFEASNHYFYVEQDLLEKILNCNDLGH